MSKLAGAPVHIAVTAAEPKRHRLARHTLPRNDQTLLYFPRKQKHLVYVRLKQEASVAYPAEMRVTMVVDR